MNIPGDSRFKRVFIAWLLGLLVLAFVCAVFGGGGFPIGWHAAAATGPVLLVLPFEAAMDWKMGLVLFYGVSLLAAYGFSRIRYSLLWVVLWFLLGLVFLWLKLNHHFSI